LLKGENLKKGDLSPKKHPQIAPTGKKLLAAKLYDFEIDYFDVYKEQHWEQFTTKVCKYKSGLWMNRSIC